MGTLFLDDQMRACVSGKVETDTPLASALAHIRIEALYAWRHGRRVNLQAPSRFTELVQLRKLKDRSPLQTVLMDKVEAKRLAGSRLGQEWIVPTLWEGRCLPSALPKEGPVMIKARHGCNQYVVLERPPPRQVWRRVQRLSDRWQRKPYGQWLDEWAYRDVERGVIVEPLLGGRLPLPIDYKIYVFGGVATHVQVHLDRGQQHRWILHDRNWNRLVPTRDKPAAPASLPRLLDAAEELRRGRSFIRVDFYEVERTPYFGEFCLYPGSGLDAFAADWIDVELGRLWLDALGAQRNW